MKRIKNVIELQEIDIKELVHFSKQMKSPIITITDDLSATAFNYVVAVADKLKLVFFIVKGTSKIAFINNVKVAEKICQILQVKRQYMFYYSKSKGDSKPFKRYIVRAFDKNNNKIEPFINTDLQDTSAPTLEQYDFKHKRYVMNIRGYCNNEIESFAQLKQDKIEFIKNGSLEKI